MPQQLAVAVENNFTKGLITESSGLNFPENAATDTDNCMYTLIGEVTRRLGYNQEENGVFLQRDRNDKVITNPYLWKNVAGDGTTSMVVQQIGDILYFYRSSAATEAEPLSARILNSTINIYSFLASGSASAVQGVECQFTSGNGYLFVFHPMCDPFYCTYDLSTGVVTANIINIQIRDFTGVKDPLGIATRPLVQTAEHLYNLANQGWSSSPPWQATSTPAQGVGSGARAFNIGTVTGISNGDNVTITSTAFTPYAPIGTILMSGVVTSYAAPFLFVTVTNYYVPASGQSIGNLLITPQNHGYIDTWNIAVGNLPSNSDVWWNFKNSSGAFDPATTYSHVTINTGYAPKGHFIVQAFNQAKSTVSGVNNISTVSTTARPQTGCWHAGRIWYAGVDGYQAAHGNAENYTWTESIYFSQIVTGPEQFGFCYQTNDPTSETLFDILPTDGGVITIQGCGQIRKLFPIQNGILVHCQNGIWFITGSTGIGFAANDYTVTKISDIPCLSGQSFVSVLGYPYFWNEDGIYMVAQSPKGFSVDSLTISTIQTFYDNIPVSCKRNARGMYDPVNYVVQWAYRDTEPANFTQSYNLNRILNFNTYNKAFYPYTAAEGGTIHGLAYVPSTTALGASPSAVKYFSSIGVANNLYNFTFSEERDEDYKDWGTADYTSYFIAGYRLRGQAIKKFNVQYVQMWYQTDGGPSAYTIQGIWDYANNPNSGRYTNLQTVDTGLSRFSTLYKRHKLRGQGYALQIKVASLSGKYFNIQGWATSDTVNASV